MQEFGGVVPRGDSTCLVSYCNQIANTDVPKKSDLAIMASSFTDQQLTSLQIAEAVSSGLSFVCSIAVISVCFSKKNPDPNRMVCIHIGLILVWHSTLALPPVNTKQLCICKPGFLAISDLGLSITTLMGRAFVNYPHSLPCMIQGITLEVCDISAQIIDHVTLGWMVHVFFVSTMLWNAAMA